MKRLWTAFAAILVIVSLTGVIAMAAPVMDLNGDGVVDEADQRWLMQYLVGKTDLPEGMTEGDVDLNGNGRVDIFEAVLVQQYIEGIIDELPDQEIPEENELKTPDGLSAWEQGEVYRFGMNYYGYTDYFMVGEDGRAVMAVVDEVGYAQDYDVAFTDCYGLIYRVQVGTVTENRSGGELSFVTDTECFMMVLDGGTEAELAYLKDRFRFSKYDYAYLSADGQAAVDAMLDGALYGERALESDDYITGYQLAFDLDGRLASRTTYETYRGKTRFVAEERYLYDGEIPSVHTWYDEDGSLVRMEECLYHENGMIAQILHYDDGEHLSYHGHFDSAGALFLQEYYRDGELAEVYRYEYDYRPDGGLAQRRTYHRYLDEPEHLQAVLTVDESYNAVYRSYYENETVSREYYTYADYRTVWISYDDEGRVELEEAWGSDGYQEYAKYYFEGQLQESLRMETERLEDGTRIRRTYRAYSDIPEFLHEVDTYYPDGSSTGVSYDSLGEITRESYSDGAYVWWEKQYADGELIMEAGGTATEYYRLYYENGVVVLGEHVVSVVEDGILKEQLEYSYTGDGEKYLYRRTEYNENRDILFEYTYRPDGEVSCTLRYVYETGEDGAAILTVYQQYAGGEETFYRKQVDNPDGSSREETYQEGDLTYVNGTDAQGKYFYEEYQYGWDEEYGKYLSYVSKGGDGVGSSQYYYYPDGTLGGFSVYNPDGSYSGAEYYPDGSISYKAVTNSDGSGYERYYGSDGMLVREHEKYPGGLWYREVEYNPDGSLNHALRYEYTFFEDGTTVWMRYQYNTYGDQPEYLAYVAEYDRWNNVISETSYRADGSLEWRVRVELVLDEYGNYVSKKTYTQYGDGPEFLSCHEEYRDGSVVYFMQYDSAGRPVYEESYDEFWNRSYKEWSYGFDLYVGYYLSQYLEMNADGSGCRICYAPDGTVLEEERWDAEGNRTLYMVELYDDGSVKREAYRDDSANIHWEKEYFWGGGLYLETHYNADGSYRVKRYYENGVLWEYTEYDCYGHQTVCELYNENGDLAEIHHFEYEYYEDGTVASLRCQVTTADGTEYLAHEGYYDQQGRCLKFIQYNMDGSIQQYQRHEYITEGDTFTHRTYNMTEDGIEYLCWEDYTAPDRYERRTYEANQYGAAVLVYEEVSVYGGSTLVTYYYLNGNMKEETYSEYDGGWYNRKYTEDGILYYEWVVDGDGNGWRKEFHANGSVHLIHIIRNNNLENTEEYDEDGRLLQIYDLYGNVLEEHFYQEDENGQVYLYQSVYYKDEQTHTIEYDAQGNVLWETEQEGGYNCRREYACTEGGLWYLAEKIESWAGGDYYRCVYYPDGTLRQESQTDINGTGYNRGYYENGVLWYEEIMESHQQVSTTWYNEDGSFYCQNQYETYSYVEYEEHLVYVLKADGKRYLESRNWVYPNGDQVTWMYDEDGDWLSENHWTGEGYSYKSNSYTYDENGVKYVREYAEYYVDGSYYIATYSRPDIMATEQFFDTSRNGYDKRYDENGVLRVEYVYENGVVVRVIEYDEDGNGFVVDREENDFDEYGRHVERRGYHRNEDGTEYLILRYRYNPETGYYLVQYFDADGDVLREENNYYDGECYVKTYEYSYEGETKYLSRCLTEYAGGGSYEAHYISAGHATYEGTKGADGSWVDIYRTYWEDPTVGLYLYDWSEYRSDGSWHRISYNASGAVIYEDLNENGVHTRYSFGYYSSGKLSMESYENLTDGTGYVKCYFESGVLESEKQISGGLDAFYKIYTEDGELWSSTRYEYTFYENGNVEKRYDYYWDVAYEEHLQYEWTFGTDGSERCVQYGHTGKVMSDGTHYPDGTYEYQGFDYYTDENGALYLARLFVHERDGKETTTFYDAEGDVMSLDVRTATDGYSETYLYAYDANGIKYVEKHTRTEYFYYENGDMKQRDEYAYEYPSQELRLERQTFYAEDGSYTQKVYSYDANGILMGWTEICVDAQGNTTETWYDAP